YIKVLGNTSPILKRIGIFLTLNVEEINRLEKEATTLQNLIDKLPAYTKEDAVLSLISIYSLIDIEEAEKIYLKYNENIPDSNHKKFLFGNIKEFKKEYNEAKDIYLEILKNDFFEELMFNILNCMVGTRDYEEYIGLYEKYR